jgi:hypothetical protein
MGATLLRDISLTWISPSTPASSSTNAESVGCDLATHARADR